MVIFLEENNSQAVKLNTIKTNLNKFRIEYNNGCPSSNVPTSLDYDYDLAELNRLFLDVATKFDTMDSLKSFSLIYLKKLYKEKCLGVVEKIEFTPKLAGVQIGHKILVKYKNLQSSELNEQVYFGKTAVLLHHNQLKQLI